jgi:hypothetical protein
MISGGVRLKLGELSLDAIEMEVDLPLVVSSELHSEHDVVHLGRVDRRIDPLTVQRGFDPVQEEIDFLDLVATPK